MFYLTYPCPLDTVFYLTYPCPMEFGVLPNLPLSLGHGVLPNLPLSFGHGGGERRQEDRGREEDGDQEGDFLASCRGDQKHKHSEDGAGRDREDQVGCVESSGAFINTWWVFVCVESSGASLHQHLVGFCVCRK